MPGQGVLFQKVLEELGDLLARLVAHGRHVLEVAVDAHAARLGRSLGRRCCVLAFGLVAAEGRLLARALGPWRRHCGVVGVRESARRGPVASPVYVICELDASQRFTNALALSLEGAADVARVGKGSPRLGRHVRIVHEVAQCRRPPRAEASQNLTLRVGASAEGASARARVAARDKNCSPCHICSEVRHSSPMASSTGFRLAEGACPTSAARWPSWANAHPTATKASLDTVLASATTNPLSDLPQLVVLATSSASLLYGGASGLADPPDPAVPITRNSIFDLFSATKLITAICALQLVERSLLALDDDASRWVPELKGKKIFKGWSENDEMVWKENGPMVTVAGRLETPTARP